MSIEELKEKVEELRKEFFELLKEASDLKELENLRIRFLGRKSELTGLLRNIGKLPQEHRKEAGKLLNLLKSQIEQEIKKAKDRLGTQIKRIDLTLPGRLLNRGRMHPITRAFTEIIEIFKGLGFELEQGPDIEWDYYNFEALNIPKYHPAREMQSTFFITDEMLLRTHTSPVQIRGMLKRKPPVRFIAPGKVYRVDPFDASHAPAFHQLEGLYVDKNVSFAELKGTIEIFAREFFGKDIEIRFVPAYFPFTEPSAAVHIRWKGSDWLEVLGCGVVHPNVLKAVNIKPEEWSGYAFGFGIERMVMVKYGINDIRHFYENDIRFLEGYH